MKPELEIESLPAAAGVCFPEPAVEDRRIRQGEGEQAFLARSTRPFAIEMRRFMNANLRILPGDVSERLCRALRGEDFRASFFELVVARTVQVLGASDLRYELATQTGTRPDLRATFGDGTVVIDATVPEFDAEIEKDQDRYRPLIEIVEDLAPNGWGFFVEALPEIGPNDSQREFKRTITAEFAKLADLVPPTVSPFSPGHRVLRAGHPQGEIRLLLGGRSADDRPFAGGPASAAFGDTDARVAKALRRKRAQLRGGDVPALVAIAGGMGETIEDFDIALFGRTFERQDEYRRVVETGFSRTGIWAKLQGGETVIAGVLAFCRWQWTTGDDPVLYLNPRFTGTLPRALSALHRRELTDEGIRPSAPLFTGVFPLLRAAAGLDPR